MRKVIPLATVGVMLLALAVAVPAAEQGAAQSKTGVVKKVDVAANQIVVMVKRELTFAVTEATQIVQGDQAKKLADVKVDTKVTVEYTRNGGTRTATKITILADN